MNRILFAGLIVVALVAACGSDPTATPTTAPTATATPLPPGAPEPTATNTPTAQQLFEEEWSALIAAAQSEGELQLEEPLQIADCSRLILDAFEREFGISSTMTQFGGSTLRERIFAEQAAGQYLWDFSGMSGGAINRELVPGGALHPIKELFVHPEVVDVSQWFGGTHYFGDVKTQQFAFIHSARVRFPPVLMYYNTNKIDPMSITSYWDLLEPNLAAQIVASSPVGQRTAYVDTAVHPDLGHEWTAQFLKNRDVTFVDNGHQFTDFLIKGDFSLGLVPPSESRDAFNFLSTQGAPVAQFTNAMKERALISPGGTGANLIVYKNPPHPNATKLFINWFLTHDIQTMKHEQCQPGRRTIQPSMRLGVPPGNTEPSERREEGKVYLFTESPELLAKLEAAEELVRQTWAAR